MSPEHLPTTPGGRLDHLQEECAEVILAISKLKRFGNRRWPDDCEKTNQEKLALEMKDLTGAIRRAQNDLPRRFLWQREMDNPKLQRALNLAQELSSIMYEMGWQDAEIHGLRFV